jgi:hypothetical protein
MITIGWKTQTGVGTTKVYGGEAWGIMNISLTNDILKWVLHPSDDKAK